MVSLPGTTTGAAKHIKRKLRKKLLEWFHKEKRSFPWRKTRSPYRILIAEKLLQQTLAGSRVVVAYNFIIEAFPTVYDLAKADLRKLKPIVVPLGLRYRAKELKILAHKLIEKHDGKIPKTLGELLGLPGIGNYAARAILCFAYGQPYAVVDTNVARFLFRVFDLPGAMPPNPARSRMLTNLAQEILPTNQAKDFNLAILDLCAKICKPQNPLCDECPIQGNCCYAQFKEANSKKRAT